MAKKTRPPLLLLTECRACGYDGPDRHGDNRCPKCGAGHWETYQSPLVGARAASPEPEPTPEIEQIIAEQRAASQRVGARLIGEALAKREDTHA